MTKLLIPLGKTQPLFLLGMVTATPGFLDWAEANSVNYGQYVALHVTGDYGTMDAEDVQANKDSIKYGNRIMSEYEVDGTKFWIITEADRSVTTLLLPNEY